MNARRVVRTPGLTTRSPARRKRPQIELRHNTRYSVMLLQPDMLLPVPAVTEPLRAEPKIRAASRIASAGTSARAATNSGVKRSTSRSSSSKPTTFSRTNARSTRPDSDHLAQDPGEHRGIVSGSRLDVERRALRGLAAARVDHDELETAGLGALEAASGIRVGNAAGDRDERIRTDQHPDVGLVEGVAAGEPLTVGGGGGLLAGLVDRAAREAQAKAQRIHPGRRHRRRLRQLVEERPRVHRDGVGSVAIEDRLQPHGDLVHRPLGVDRLERARWPSRAREWRRRFGLVCISGKCFPLRQKKPSEWGLSLSPRAETGRPSASISTTIGHCAVQIRQRDFFSMFFMGQQASDPIDWALAILPPWSLATMPARITPIDRVHPRPGGRPSDVEIRPALPCLAFLRARRFSARRPQRKCGSTFSPNVRIQPS